MLIPEVEPVKSEAAITSGGHSGWVRTIISGFCFLISSISCALNLSCTIQVPTHDIIWTFVFDYTYFAMYWSGKKITLSAPRDSTTLTALADVQQISDSALTSADVFT